MFVSLRVRIEDAVKYHRTVHTLLLLPSASLETTQYTISLHLSVQLL